MVRNVSLRDIGTTNFLLGTRFLRSHSAVCDFRAMKLYVLLGSQYYCIDLAGED